MLLTHSWPSCSRAAFYTVRRLTRDLQDDKLPVYHFSRTTRCHLYKQCNDFIQSFECALILARVSSDPLNSQALAGSYILNDSETCYISKEGPQPTALLVSLEWRASKFPARSRARSLDCAVCSCRELLRQIWSRR
jgi:hypothetical protein